VEYARVDHAMIDRQERAVQKDAWADKVLATSCQDESKTILRVFIRFYDDEKFPIRRHDGVRAGNGD
jgi:hypothetical protein